MAGNKSDLFDKAQVPEDDARKFASEIGAVFQLTSAYSGKGIEELFKSIGYKYFDLNNREEKKSDSTNNTPEPVTLESSDLNFASNKENKISLSSNEILNTENYSNEELIKKLNEEKNKNNLLLIELNNEKKKF